MRARRLLELVALPSRRELLETLGAGLLIALACWFFGVDIWHAILLGAAITVIAIACLIGSTAPDAREISWRPGTRASREGSRNDVASLSTSLRVNWAFVGLTAERRLQLIARRRLALSGLNLSNPEHRPAIEQLIGRAAYRALTSQKRRPTLRTLTYCLDMLDATDSAHYPAPPPRSRRWDLSTIPFSLRRARDR